LYVALEVEDEAITDRDRVSLALHFPDAGVTAGGGGCRCGAGGKLGPRPEAGVTPATLALVDAAVHRTKKGMSLEVALPARALPRFPARDSLVLELCLSYEDADDAGPAAKEISTCVTGAPPPELLALPAGFRTGLRPRPPPEVQTVAGRPGGGGGCNGQVDPKWVLGDRPLNEQSLRMLVSEAPIDPAAVRVYVPSRMQLPDGKALLAVLTGQDPYGQDDSCAPEREMRLAVFWVKG